MRFKGRLRAIGVLLALAPSAAFAGNLAANGHFDVAVEPWAFHDGDGAITYNAISAFCPTQSGSGYAENRGSNNAPYASFAQCITGIASEGHYRAGAQVFFPTGDDPAAGFYVFMIWYGSTDCTGGNLGSVSLTSIGQAPLDTWRGTSDQAWAPIGAQSALMSLRIGHNPPNDGNAYLDEAFFSPEADIFNDGFELALPCQWSAVVP